MTGYARDRCPLAFEIGYYGYWDLSGGCVKYICRHCGTMHKIEHLQRQSDMLYAVDGPVRSMVEVPVESADGETHKLLRLPITHESWRLVGPLPTAAEFLQGLFILPRRAQAVMLDRIPCAHCQRVGGLVSREWPLSAAGTWPAFGESCPVCRGPLRWVYVETIN
jgi:hypothetical protein